MLTIEAVRFQNVFSFGNELTEVRFDRSRSTLVVGRNGAGKSSAILDTLLYGLYGKPYRKIRLGQMLNSITGRDALVEVEFTARGRSYRILRGQKPAVFEVYRDGHLVDQADKSRDQQEWLEKSVLMMDQRTFTQIVVLGSANHVPFMQLPAGQRREVIEDILDIQVFSAMNQVLKERVGSVKDELAERERDLAVAVRELEVEERHLETIRRDVGREREEKLREIEGLRAELPSYAREIERYRELIEEATRSIDDAETVRQKLEELKTLRTKLLDRSDRLGREVSFYEGNDSCPTCRQAIDPTFRAEAVERGSSTIRDINRGLERLNDEIRMKTTRMEEVAEATKRIAAMDRAQIQLSSDSRSVSRRIEDREGELAQLDDETEVDRGLIEELRSRVEELGRLRDVTVTEARTMAQASLLLKDQGIKARIVAQYVPLMNRLVNKYLASLEMFVDFHLDENFNEEIRSRHRDSFSYANFSEGEKLRIDLAILFAWRDIARMRSSSATDLIIFDEILDGSLDAEGADYFLRLVQDLTDDCHVFIISHREGLEDKFNRTLNFVKRNNFSRMVESSVDIPQKQDMKDQ